MVLQKRIDCGFNGYDVPRATRSPRKSVFKKKSDHQNHQISSFDLLAEVAGKIMLESEKTSSTSNNEDHCVVATKEHGYDHEHMVTEETNYNNAEKRFFVSEILPKSHVMDQMLNRSPSPIKDFYYGSTSGLTSDSSEKFETQDIAYNYEETKIDHNGDHSYKTESNDKKPMLVRQDIEEKLPNNVVDKDENHISSGFMKQVTQNSSVCGEKLSANFATKSFRSTLRIGDGRIKKVLASKYCKVSPKINNDTMVTNSDLDLKQGYIRKKHCIRSLRSERNYPIKKRRYFDGYVASQPEESIKNETHSVSPKKASGFLSSIACQKQPTFKPKDSQYVKLGIKSFRVPELFIEIPETSTIGSLKRTVMETLTTILGDGLHIGVNVHGKKVRDDNKLLLHQSGTSLDNLSDTIEFCLEPNPCNVVSNTLTRCHTKPNSCVESDIDSRSSVPNKAKTVYSRALVPFNPLHAQALTIVPPRKPKRSEVAQRRIRRPFSVSEVEALVQAVERLGTGRWRDVKMRAFEYAKHRTYVDLKDKWKTLVHTARISPQQRRGEPVPQELLDRVLTAHAYWSHQQGKQQFLEGPHKLETSLGL